VDAAETAAARAWLDALERALADDSAGARAAALVAAVLHNAAADGPGHPD